MAKAIMGKSKEDVEATKELAKEPLPDIAFTEQEVQQVADFINYVFKNGTFSMAFGDIKKVSTMLQAMHAHVAKIEKYIFEHRRIIAAKKAVE